MQCLAIGRDRLGVPPEILQRETEVAVGPGAVGLLAEGALVRGDRLLEATLQPQDVAELSMDRHQARIERQRAFVGCERIPKLALPLQDLRQGSMRLGLVAGGKGIFQPISRREHNGQIDVRRGVRGLELDGRGVGARRLGIAALALEKIAQAEVGPRVPGGQSDRLLAGGERFLELAEFAQDGAEVHQRVGIVRPYRQASADEGGGGFAVARLVLDQAEVMQARGMPRIDRQDALVRGPGFRQPAGLQMLHRDRKRSGQPRIAAGLPARAASPLRGPPLLPVHRCRSGRIAAER